VLSAAHISYPPNRWPALLTNPQPPEILRQRQVHLSMAWHPRSTLGFCSPPYPPCRSAGGRA
jgi:hypothetical protein